MKIINLLVVLPILAISSPGKCEIMGHTSLRGKTIDTFESTADSFYIIYNTRALKPNQQKPIEYQIVGPCYKGETVKVIYSDVPQVRCLSPYMEERPGSKLLKISSKEKVQEKISAATIQATSHANKIVSNEKSERINANNKLNNTIEHTRNRQAENTRRIEALEKANAKLRKQVKQLLERVVN